MLILASCFFQARLSKLIATLPLRNVKKKGPEVGTVLVVNVCLYLSPAAAGQ